MINKQKIKEIIESLKDSKGYHELSLDEFRETYKEIIRENQLKDDKMFMVFLEDKVISVFVEKPDVRFMTSGKNKFFTEKDFDFVLNKDRTGTYAGKYTFIQFLKKEIELNWKKLIPIFTISLILFILANNANVLKDVNNALLLSTTIFISMFLLFIASKHNGDYRLIKDDTYYKFFQNDKYISSIAVFIIILIILSIALTNLSFEFIVWGYKITEIIFVSLITSISITLLSDCFFAVIKYYFERPKWIDYMNFSEKLLNDVKNMKERNI